MPRLPGRPRLSSVVALFAVLALAAAASGSSPLLQRRARLQPAKARSFARVLGIHGGAVATATQTTSSAVAKLALPLPAAKLLLQLALSLLNVVCWLVPLRSQSFSQNKNALSLANAFAGGIFLMLGIGHLVPHSLEALHSIHANTNMTFYAVLAGFLAMLFIEKVAFNSHALLHSVESGDHNHSHIHEHIEAVAPQAAAAANAPVGDASCTLDHVHTAVSTSPMGKKEGGTLSPTTAIVLLSAMSVHSLFETMALGIASDHVSATLMAISIALHQPAESMALLVAFLKTSMPKQAIIRWLGLFSGVGIVGVTLGLIISQVANPLVDAVLVAITAGTFLYVGATEICNEEFEEGSTKDKLIKFSALAGGIAIIGLISSVSERWLESSHGHSH